MIRIHLGPEALGRVRVAVAPDYDAELTSAGRRHAQSRLRSPDLLAQLCTPTVHPDLGDDLDPAYLPHLFGLRRPTRFTYALAEGDPRAHGTLTDVIGALRKAAITPRRAEIRATVAAQAAIWSQIYVAQGATALLNRLHPGVRVRRGCLEVPTMFETDIEAGDRPIVVQAVALGEGVTMAELAGDELCIRLPTGGSPRLRMGRKSSLTALLGPARAETLRAIVGSGGLTGRQLASVLGVSEATASRHASVLRGARLIQSMRFGQTVRHIATSLGYQLAAETDEVP